MPTPHEATTVIAASPGRDFLIHRIIYTISGDEDPTDLVVIDPISGIRPDGLAYNGRLFWLDPLDSTTPHDGITCIRTADPLRYKRDTIDPPKSVLDKDLSAPPVTSVAIGDAFIVGPAATGAWAGHSDDIAILTSGGYGFITPVVGLSIYVEDEESTYHVDTLGNWVIGIGSNALAADSVLPSQLKGGGGRERWIFENQTTNVPPAVTEGTAYVVGPSPTGVWTGSAGKIANGENGAWVIYTPLEGWFGYDKALDSNYLYTGSAWITASGNLTLTISPFVSPGSFTWNKPARLAYIIVDVVGGGGGSPGNAGNGGNGGTSSFGAHESATGGVGGVGSGSTPGAPGAGSSGQLNFSGQKGGYLLFAAGTSDASFNGTVHGGDAGLFYGEFGRGGPVEATSSGPTSGAGGGGARKVIQAASLGSTETVTVGAAGAVGSSPAGMSVAGGAGLVVVYEYTFS